jgi:Ca2+-transporting ATPase
MVMSVYFISIREGHTLGEVRAIAFSSLIIGNIFLILTNLSKTRSFLSTFHEKNVAAVAIPLAALGMLILAISVPALQRLFDFEFPGFWHFLPSIVGASLVLAILESIKYFRYKKGKAENNKSPLPGS